MTAVAIAAAGTGGHVYPGLAVGQALLDAGLSAEEIIFLGGDRLEKSVYPKAGFPFVELPLAGLKRSLSLENLKLPVVILRATKLAEEALRAHEVSAVLAMGSYVTIPAGWAARRVGARFYTHEANAELGLANRVMGRFAAANFVSFETTEAVRAEHTGNPIRSELARFDRGALRPEAVARYGLSPRRLTVGVVGGSLGAAALNGAIGRFTAGEHKGVQVVHVAGPDHAADLVEMAGSAATPWHVVAFEDRMDLFFAACDLVVSRSGGMVSELMATGTPSILVPGGFGAAGHQSANADVLAAAGCAVVVPEDELDRLTEEILELTDDAATLVEMGRRARSAAKPEAADIIAAILLNQHLESGTGATDSGVGGNG